MFQPSCQNSCAHGVFWQMASRRRLSGHSAGPYGTKSLEFLGIRKEKDPGSDGPGIFPRPRCFLYAPRWALEPIRFSAYFLLEIWLNLWRLKKLLVSAIFPISGHCAINLGPSLSPKQVPGSYFLELFWKNGPVRILDRILHDFLLPNA